MLAELQARHILANDGWDNFTETDHKTWACLCARQAGLLGNGITDEVAQGLERLNISQDRIPMFSEINAAFQQSTGFSIVPVDGLVPEALFFSLLAERKFPSTCFIRQPHQLDYLEEPDIFHDIYGHIPPLANPVFADFIQEFGRKALQTIELGLVQYAAAIYWFTVEFGLIKTANGLAIYGAGISSSVAESERALNSLEPVRLDFNLQRMMQTSYRTDTLQNTYFIIESFQQLYNTLRDLDWHELHASCLQQQK